MGAMEQKAGASIEWPALLRGHGRQMNGEQAVPSMATFLPGFRFTIASPYCGLSDADLPAELRLRDSRGSSAT